MNRLSLLPDNATDSEIDCAVQLDLLDPLCSTPDCPNPAEPHGQCAACRWDAERDALFWMAVLVVGAAIERINAAPRMAYVRVAGGEYAVSRGSWA